MSATVEWEMVGAMPRSRAARARLRVDQWVMCSPIPAGSQHASRSTSTRWRGGKLPRAAGARCILHGLHAECLEAATQSPDGPAVLFESVGQLRDDGVRVRHRQQDARSANNTLLGSSASHQALKEGYFLGRKVDESWRSSPHPPELCIPCDYVHELVGQSTRGRIVPPSWICQEQSEPDGCPGLLITDEFKLDLLERRMMALSFAFDTVWDGVRDAVGNVTNP